MPWAVDDVDGHMKGLSDKLKKLWVKVANSARKNCITKGGDEKECDVSAIKQANAIAGKAQEALVTVYQAVVDKIVKLAEAGEELLEDWLYLIHHVVVDGEEEIIHHCLLVDHLGNKFEVDHLAVEDSTYHVVKGLAPDQEIFWSNEEAMEAGEKVPCANRQLN